MTYQVEHLQGPASASRLALLSGVDVSTHDALVEALPWLADHLEGDRELATLAELLTQVATEAPEAAQELARRLGSEAQIAADAMGLRKWVLHGLQHYRRDPKRRLNHFAWSDPRVFADRRTENDSAHLLAHRDGLLHYLDGFGCHKHGIELHNPIHPKLPQPAAAVGDEMIRMPRRCDGVDPSKRALLYRATMAHIAAHLRYSPVARLAGNRRPRLLAVMALIEDARVERLMAYEYPGLWELWGLFHVATRETAGFDFAGLTARLARALHDLTYDDSNAWVMEGRTLFEQVAARDLYDVAGFDRIARELSIRLGVMRLDAPMHYRPSPVYRDDNSVLWDARGTTPEDEEQKPVIEEVDVGSQIETPRDFDLSNVDLRHRFRYPEWDHKLETLREDWVTVIEIPSAAQKAPNGSKRFNAERRPRMRGLDRTPDRSIRRNRLPEGDELDITAAVDNAIEQRANLAPDGRIFRRHGRRRRATAIVLLMDLSASTGRFVPGSFTTVMDFEKQAAMTVAQALDDRRDRVAVHGFASNGRNEVNYQRIKDFDEPFDAPQQARLDGLSGGLSTRMGAALRHASTALDGQDADQKVILMLTDGEPSDVDVVEDDYLVEDARHAVAAAASRGIRTFCLTLDRRADGYVRRIFGARNFLIADRADAFAGKAGQTLVRLAAH